MIFYCFRLQNYKKNVKRSIFFIKIRLSTQKKNNNDVNDKAPTTFFLSYVMRNSKNLLFRFALFTHNRNFAKYFRKDGNTIYS